MAVGAEAIFGDSVITTKLDSAINWARESSCALCLWHGMLRDRVYECGK